jgi:hypothetical protein
LNGYRGRTLAAEALLRIADHLAVCEDCRGKLRLVERTGEAIAELRQAVESHLSAEQVQHFVDGELGAGERADVEQHVAWCTECSSDVQALREFAKAQQPPVAVARRVRSWWLATAAAVLLTAIGLGVWLRRPVEVAALNDVGRRITLDSRGRLVGAAGLSSTQAESVRRVLMGAALVPSVNLNELQLPRSSLMGTQEVAGFRLVAPVGTAVRSSSPELRWTARGSRAEYVVTLKNLATGQVISSPSLRDLAWAPSQPLQRGVIYAWQVAASLDGREEVAPSPPSPQARFLVLDANTAARLDSLPPSHLVRAALDTEAGLLDEAELEAKALENENPASAIASNLLRHIQSLHNPGVGH